MKWTLILVMALAGACGSVGSGDEVASNADPAVEAATSESELSSAQFRVFVNGNTPAATASLCCTYANGGSCGCGPDHPACCSSCNCNTSPPTTATVLHVQSQ